MKRHASMNRAYRLVWSHVRNVWIAVAENAKGRGKSGRSQPLSRRKLVATAISLAFAPLAQAAPIGGQVVAGSGSISQSGNITTINQSTQNLSLNWQSFNIAKQETVNFQQPSATAIAVNRIFDTNGSQILGHLNANGQVWLINPNGVLFGQGAQVNVGGLVASTLEVGNNSNGTVSFAGSGTGSVVNQGAINAASGGYVALLGNSVSNQGVITAQLGTVALGAGSAATLTFSGNSLVKMQIDQSTLNALAENKQLIQADGGMVLMSAGAQNALLASVVNNTGVIEARTVENHNGTITLLGGMSAGTVNAGGTLDASAPNGGNGGFIETSAAHVKVADNARITTAAASGLNGTWLIDPIDFTIAAGSGALTTSGIGATTLSANLGGGDIVIATNATTAGNGDIFVNSAVSWSANKLTLSAYHDIVFGTGNAINGGSSGSVDLTAGGAIIASTSGSYDVRAGTLTATAATGIGTSSAALRTALSNAALTNTTSGGIYLINTGDITVTASSTNGDINISTANGAAGTNGAIVTTGGNGNNGGNGGNAGNITIGSLTTITSGNISIGAGAGGTGGNGSGAGYPSGLVPSPISGNAGNGGTGGSVTVNVGSGITSAGTLSLAAGRGGSSGMTGWASAFANAGLAGTGGAGGAVSVSGALSGTVVSVLGGAGGAGGTGGLGSLDFAPSDGGDGGRGGSVIVGSTITARQGTLTVIAGNGNVGGTAGALNGYSYGVANGNNGGNGGNGGLITVNAALTGATTVALTGGNGGNGGNSEIYSNWPGLYGSYGTGGKGGDGGGLTLSAAVSSTGAALNMTGGNGGGGGIGWGIITGGGLYHFGSSGSTGGGGDLTASSLGGLSFGAGTISARNISLSAGSASGGVLALSGTNIAADGTLSLAGYELSTSGSVSLTGSATETLGAGGFSNTGSVNFGANSFSVSGSFTNSGSLTATGGITIDSGANALGTGALNAGGATLSLTTTSSVIGTGTLTAGTLTISAGTGIGSVASPLSAAVTQAALSNSGSGGIYLTNS